MDRFSELLLKYSVNEIRRARTEVWDALPPGPARIAELQRRFGRDYHEVAALLHTYDDDTTRGQNG